MIAYKEGECLMTRRAGSIKKRGDRKYVVRIYMGTDEDGKRIYHNKTIHGTKKDAQRYLTKVQREKDLGTFVEPSRESLDTHLDEWLTVSIEPRVRERTLASYREMLDLYIRPELGKRPISNLKPAEIQRTTNDMTGRGLSPRTVKYAHRVLKMALEQAVKWQKIRYNPANLTDLPKSQAVEMKTLSEAEVHRFLEAARETPWYPLFVLAISTGMRSGEILALQWKDIDFRSARLGVQRSLTRLKGGVWRFTNPKTPRAKRQISLPPSVIDLLTKHRKMQAEIRLAAGSKYENHDLVFASDTGQPLNHRNIVRRHFKPLLRSVGLPDVRFYDLRHTHATLLLGAGENPKVVSERLGHASIVLTLDTYSHVLPDMQQQSAEKIEGILFGGG